jgi:nucleotide-binding universal stress UspA family protein
MAGEVILGFDGQDGSQAALRTAVLVAAAFKRPLIITFGYAPTAMGGEVSDLSDTVQTLGKQITSDAVKAVRALDPTVEVKAELVNDRPAEAILRAASQYDALTIVVGAAGRGPIAGALLGSVTYQVVHRSTRPVLVVPTPPEA